MFSSEELMRVPVNYTQFLKFYPDRIMPIIDMWRVRGLKISKLNTPIYYRNNLAKPISKIIQPVLSDAK